jgi:hypothetical protein
MPDQQNKAPPPDIERRIIKKWGTNTFVGMINTVPAISNRVHTALVEGLKAIEEELQEAGEGASDLFPIDTVEAEEAVLLGPQSRVLTKVLYRMSLFFSSMKMVSISHVKVGKKSKPAVRLHQEVGEGLRAAKTTNPLDLDPFNQYVFLHMLSFVRDTWRKRRDRDDWKNYRKTVEEAVRVKIEALTAATEAPSEEE